MNQNQTLPRDAYQTQKQVKDNNYPITHEHRWKKGENHYDKIMVRPPQCLLWCGIHVAYDQSCAAPP
jgi:hypothetical protein